MDVSRVDDGRPSHAYRPDWCSLPQVSANLGKVKTGAQCRPDNHHDFGGCNAPRACDDFRSSVSLLSVAWLNILSERSLVESGLLPFRFVGRQSNIPFTLPTYDRQLILGIGLLIGTLGYSALVGLGVRVPLLWFVRFSSAR